MNIPKSIVIEVDNLEIGDAIHVKDITLPEGVRTKQDPDTILVTVVPPMKEEVAMEEGPKEPEVLKEKKPVEGEGKEEKAEGKKEEKAESKK